MKRKVKTEKRVKTANLSHVDLEKNPFVVWEGLKGNSTKKKKKNKPRRDETRHKDQAGRLTDCPGQQK